MSVSLFHSFRKWSGKELWIAVGLRWKLTIYACLFAIVNTTGGKTNISQLQTDPNCFKNVVKQIYFIISTIYSATLSKKKYRIQILCAWSVTWPKSKVGTQKSTYLRLSPVTNEVRYLLCIIKRTLLVVGFQKVCLYERAQADPQYFFNVC